MKSCLIIEDSEVVRDVAARIVEGLSLTPVMAAGAPEAISLVGEKTPDVVLLDWNLPETGALEFLRFLRSQPADGRPPVVLCAAEYEPQQFALARAAGAAHHILKPYDAEAVSGILHEVGVL